MRLSKEGIYFNYHGDELLWFWPWIKSHGRYYSTMFEGSYPSLRKYWYHCGAWNEAFRKEKVIGFSDLEVLLGWAKREFSHNTVIIIRNINVEMRSTEFWRSVDAFAKRQLLKDVSVLFFPNALKAKKVFDSIDPEFAEAHLFHMGELVETNNEDNYKYKAAEIRSHNQGPS